MRATDEDFFLFWCGWYSLVSSVKCWVIVFEGIRQFAGSQSKHAEFAIVINPCIIDLGFIMAQVRRINFEIVIMLNKSENFEELSN